MPNTPATLRAGSLTVGLTFTGEKLSAVEFPPEPPADLDAAMLAEMSAQLAEFPLALDAAAPFAQAVYTHMRQIPAGSALTYRDLAALAGNPRAIRAVGNACASNRLLLIVPCHRVVAESGLGGFRLGLAWKQKLLELESEQHDAVAS